MKNKQVDMQKRTRILKTSRGLLGVLALAFFSGLIGIFGDNKPKVEKKVVVKKVEAVWG